MRKKFFLQICSIAVILAISLMVGCDKNEEKPLPTLSVFPTSLSFTEASESQTFTITSNAAWTITGAPGWATVSSTSGTGDTTITVTADANTATTERTAKLTVTVSGATPVEVNLIQAATRLSVSTTSLSFAGAGEEKTFTITTSGAWNITGVPTSWASISSSSGTGNTTIAVTANPNTATTERSAKLTITVSGATPVEVNLIQTAAATLRVSPTSLSFAGTGNDKRVNITSNAAWTASSNAEWLTLSTTTGNLNGPLTLTAAANKATTQRTATVTIMAGDITEIIAITQAEHSTSSNPIQITTDSQLRAISNNLTGHFRLMNNITVTSWYPIGNSSDNEFTGTFDGNGYAIAINSFGAVSKSGYDYFYGLFGNVKSGKISRLHVVNSVTVSRNDGSIYYGGIVGHMSGSGLIENCSVSGNLSAVSTSVFYSVVGGLVGRTNGECLIENCSVSGSLSATSVGNNTTIGGIVGMLQSNDRIRNCYATGGLTSYGGGTIHAAGGIVGEMGYNAIISACVALQSSITGSNSGRVSGYYSSGHKIEKCYARNNMTVDAGYPTINIRADAGNGAHCTNSTTDANGWGNSNFWQTTLGWSSSVWDFSDIGATSYPKLRN